MKKLKDIYVADFETITSEPTRVWLAGYCRVGADRPTACHYFNNISEFMLDLFSKCRDIKVYFHNLSFDGQFILYYLYTNNFEFENRYRPTKNGNFTQLIDENGSIFFIKININGKIVTFLDSYKLYRSSLRELAVDFNCKYKKGILDYDQHDYDNYTITQEELDYFYNDLLILSELMFNYYVMFDSTKMTISGQALHEFKKECHNYKYYFPKFSFAEDAFMRSAYRGGICMISPNIKHNKLLNIKTGVCYDYNSMYPSMLHSKSGNIYPIKKPSVIGCKEDFEIIKKYKNPFIIKCSCSYELKKGHLPCVSGLNSRFGEGEIWETSSKGHTILSLTNIDYKLLIENYEVKDFKFINGYYWKEWRKGIFDKFINKWYEVKKNGHGTQREFAKLILNSFIGKLGQKQEIPQKVYEMNKKGILKGRIMYGESSGEYLPIPIFCNAYARAELINTANKHYKDFLYCDTDSLHLKKPANDIPLGNELCQWKIENEIKKAKYIKQKFYIEKTDKKQYIVKGAGLNKNSRIIKDNDSIFKEYYIGRVFKNAKTTLKRVVGGVIIISQDFTIK